VKLSVSKRHLVGFDSWYLYPRIRTVYIDCSRSGAWSEITVRVGIVEDGWYDDSSVSELLFNSRHVYLRYVSKFWSVREHIIASISCDMKEKQR
jgi:hypothetical protein